MKTALVKVRQPDGTLRLVVLPSTRHPRQRPAKGKRAYRDFCASKRDAAQAAK